MTIATMSPGNTLPASKLNEIIGALNTLGNRQIFLFDGTFTWPTGINSIEVILCGGGGRASDVWFAGPGGTVEQPPTPGSFSPLCSKIIRGIDYGTSIAVVVGAPGSGSSQGGTSSFGAGQSYGFQSTGGTGGHLSVPGTAGTHTGDIQLGNELYIASVNPPYGRLGYGDAIIPLPNAGYNTPGGPGIVIVLY